jgi:aryl-alcohol dehydrogenase-like predicted oxidoreductase
MIDTWGGWALFQELLVAVKLVADKHRVGLAAVAIRHLLDRPAVAGVIVGTRLGVAEHIPENARAFEVAFDAEDETTLAPVLAKGRDLMLAVGDCGDEYR